LLPVPSVHAVTASAPGRASFKRVVTFSGDVFIDIELRRLRPAVRGKGKAWPAHVAKKTKGGRKSGGKAKAASERVESPGMIREPTNRRSKRPIDEASPYESGQ
jgi:hypothetical protein